MKNNFIDMTLMIKATCAFTAALFIFTGCGGGSTSAYNTTASGDSSGISSETAAITSMLEQTSTSSLTPELEPTPPQTSSKSSLKITSIEEQKTTDVSTTIAWELTEQATGHIEYGFDTSYGDVSIKEESFNYFTHIQTLSGLEPDSIYHYRIISEDADGNRVVSEDRIFKTKSDGTVSLEPAPEEESDTTTPESTTPAPDGATVITGLKTGATVAAAENNSKILNDALAGGDKNLVIPAGEWYTGKTISVQHNTILTFKGKLHQLDAAAAWEDYSVIRINSANVTLNNPHLSQKGRVGGHGTHACLMIYGAHNTGNITINGGILEWGACNNFQGGRNNTVFNGTIFRDSMEHLVYASGGKGDGNGEGRASGLTFNDCIFERPGNGTYMDIEANHIQIRQFKNVEINNCIVKGKKKTALSQYGMLVTDVDGLVVNDTSFEDYTAGLLYTGNIAGMGTKGVVFNRVTASGQGNNHIRKSKNSYDATFNDCTFNSPYGIWGDTRFNNCTFKPTGYYIKSVSGAKVTFDDSTWDYSNSTYSKAFVKESGSTVTFTGTQTKISPSDGHTLDWGLLSTEG